MRVVVKDVCHEGGGVEGWDDAGGEGGDEGSGENRNKVE